MDHQSSQLVAGIRPTTDIALIERFTRVSPDCEEPATTTNFVAESSQVVDGSMSIGFKINVNCNPMLSGGLGLYDSVLHTNCRCVCHWCSLHLREANIVTFPAVDHHRAPCGQWQCQIVLFNDRHVNCERLAESYSLNNT